MGKKSDRRAQRIADAIARNGGVDKKSDENTRVRHRPQSDPVHAANPGLNLSELISMRARKIKNRNRHRGRLSNPLSEPEKE
jgi:hypothetical protein